MLTFNEHISIQIYNNNNTSHCDPAYTGYGDVRV